MLIELWTTVPYEDQSAMKAGTDLAQIGSLVGDPARANMLAALMGGGALTASELAIEAGVTLPTASAHLAKLGGGGLVRMTPQGRHRYYALAGHDVASMLEAIMGVATMHGPRKVLPGPKDAAMREARICYDHLAGEMGVALFDSLTAQDLVGNDGDGLSVSEKGRRWFIDFGIDVDALDRSRRPLCKACLDWSARRSHLAGSLGAAMLAQMIERRWARRENDSRAITFSPQGRQTFQRLVAE